MCIATAYFIKHYHKFYNAFRERFAEICEAEAPFENGEIELDESYFGHTGCEAKEAAERQVRSLDASTRG